MGLDWQETKHGRGLRLTLDNTGQRNLGIIVAWSGDGSFSYDFQFHLRRGNTTDEYIFGGPDPDDPTVELVSAAYGLMVPKIWRLNTGSNHSLVFPINNFWRVTKGAPHDLEPRLRDGNFNVRLKVAQADLGAMMGGLAPMKNGDYWIGDLIGTIAG